MCISRVWDLQSGACKEELRKLPVFTSAWMPASVCMHLMTRQSGVPRLFYLVVVYADWAYLFLPNNGYNATMYGRVFPAYGVLLFLPYDAE
eukprot:1138064-Pelagomonas_calceolata.AAC.2